MNDTGWAVYFAGIAVTVFGAILAGTMRFASMETRVNALELAAVPTTTKLDRIAEALARIEGRLDEQRIQHASERKEDRA